MKDMSVTRECQVTQRFQGFVLPLHQQLLRPCVESVKLFVIDSRHDAISMSLMKQSTVLKSMSSQRELVRLRLMALGMTMKKIQVAVSVSVGDHKESVRSVY